MTGAQSSSSIAAFWDHCMKLDEWRDHPCLHRPSIPKERFMWRNQFFFAFPPSTNLYRMVFWQLQVSLHVDGAEFYANSEYLVWSMASIFGEGHVWDVKFPCVCIPHLLLQDFKDDVHEKVADILAWSLRCAAKGKWPSHGPFGEALTGTRAEWSEQVLAGGWRAAYFGFRYDGKARKEANRFQRSYQHNLACECCLAQKTRPSCEPLLSYKNFYPDAAHTMTSIRKALSCCLVRTHTLKHD